LLVRAHVLVVLLVAVLLCAGVPALAQGPSVSRALVASVPLAAAASGHARGPVPDGRPQARAQHEAADLELDDLELDDESDDELEDEDADATRADATRVLDAPERATAQPRQRLTGASHDTSRRLAGARLTRGPPVG
jgi:hypothetical protein